MTNKLSIIDISGPEAQVAADFHQALQMQGFAYISGHGIGKEVCDNLMGVAADFFRQDLALKNKIDMKQRGRAWRGFFPCGAELTAGVPDRKEGIYFGREHQDDHPGVLSGLPMHGRNLWPSEEMQQVVTYYMERMTKLGHTLMEFLGIGLGLNRSYFRSAFGDDPTTLFRFFNYPHVFQNPTDWGVGQHTDMGFLTILLQDNLGGLEVQSRSGGWISAPPIEGTFVINIGDMLQHWTRGIYKATLHRVRNTASVDRLSCPFFFDPHWHCKLRPIPTKLLRPEELAAVEADSFRGRWDGLDLSSLDPEAEYGEFVWQKIRNVFPWLAELSASSVGNS